MSLADVTLDDKYTLDSGRVFLTGVQALVRLPMMQRQRDLAAGLNTAGFVSGYRGSPLAGYDQQLWRAKRHLKENHIHFEPGINEDMAATAVWGTQQVGLGPKAKYDGVFATWYGKGPGVDRSGDVMRHANGAGTAKHGGVLALIGDDHNAVSSTFPHQSEHNMLSWMIPMLYPAGVQEILDYGLLGLAMSRYSGCWVGFKCVTELVESSASVYVAPERVRIALPDDFEMPPGGLNIRWPDDRWSQEIRLQKHKVYAALAFARANGLDRVVIDSPRPRFGIITTGKSYLDVRQALEDLGIDERVATKIGLRVYKVGMPWPLEREGVRQFAEGLKEVLVVEEKRAVIENQLKEQLYNWRADARPRVIGKFDETGNWLMPAHGELSPAGIALVIAQRLKGRHTSAQMKERIALLKRKEEATERAKAPIARVPYFCSGCPHNTSTKVPEGSRALAGIGCHFMALSMNRSTETFTQMGGEGVPWIGQQPFTDETHIFANLGDGTYYHSGLLAIRAAVAANVNITYKILYNDAVAMTGGQPTEGSLTPAEMAWQVHAERVKRVVVVTEDPNKYPIGLSWPPGTVIRHRDDLDAVQRELRQMPGVTALIYDQTCAAEKRRRRKRGTLPDPDKRVFINELVCEGCGDCSVASNCVSVEPLETEFGRKRQINQSSCNKDFSCVKGFCPSFVTVAGGRPRRANAQVAGGLLTGLANLPEPAVAPTQPTYNLLVTGIGGTGVVTIGQLLGMAAHLEGKGVSVLDFTGLAQKNGAVMSHIKVAAQPEDLHAPRVADGTCNLLIGCDLVVAASAEALRKIDPIGTHAILNTHLTPTADFALNPDAQFHAAELRRLVSEAAGANRTEFVDATVLATAIMGDAIATNLFMLGMAAQRGLLPVGVAAIERAIELNGVAMESNRRTFALGRMAAFDLKAVEAAASPQRILPAAPIAESREEALGRRIDFLAEYQDKAYADSYAQFVAKVEAVERERVPGQTGLTDAVLRSLFKLMAYKDEYEVARLYADPGFQERLATQFEGDLKLTFHLAPPLIASRDPRTGELRKREFGGWMLPVFRILAKLKGLRGGRFDIFGYTAERRMERRFIADYRKLIDGVLARLDRDNHDLAMAIARVPEEIRGYGHVKERSIKAAEAKWQQLLAARRQSVAQPRAAE